MRFQEDILQDIIVQLLELIEITGTANHVPVMQAEVDGIEVEAEITGECAELMIELSDLTRELLSAEIRDKDALHFETLED